MEVLTQWRPVFWVSIAIEASAAAALIVVLVVLLRITPNILAVPGKLADSRFRELIEDAPDAILQVDERGTIVIANRTAERMFGYTREELLGSNVDLLVPQAYRALHAKQRDLFVLARVPRPMGERVENLYVRRKDGTEFPAEIGLSPVKTEAGLFVTAVVRDVTDRKRLERELEQERELRGQRIEVLARLAADLAHEIKNPLAIIHARASDLSEMAAEGMALPAPVVAQNCDSIVKHHRARHPRHSRSAGAGPRGIARSHAANRACAGSSIRPWSSCTRASPRMESSCKRWSRTVSRWWCAARCRSSRSWSTC